MDARMILNRIGNALAAAAVCTGVCYSMINPEEFRRGQPESLVIRVLAVRVAGDEDVGFVSLTARVDKVVSSASGLAPGDVILVAYRRDHAKRRKELKAMEKKARRGWAGPQILFAPEAPDVGKIYRAELGLVKGDTDARGPVYEPRAHQYSFTPVEP